MNWLLIFCIIPLLPIVLAIGFLLIAALCMLVYGLCVLPWLILYHGLRHDDWDKYASPNDGW